MSEIKKTKIYTFIGSTYPSGDVIVHALDENGIYAGNHLSSCEAWAQHDIGFTSPKAAERRYAENYPNGYEVVWLTEPELDTNEIFLQPLKRTSWSRTQR